MGSQSRVAVDREGKHPIVEVPIFTNKEKQQTKLLFKTTTKKSNNKEKPTNKHNQQTEKERQETKKSNKQIKTTNEPKTSNNWKQQTKKKIK